jgi:hypothetical protein
MVDPNQPSSIKAKGQSLLQDIYSRTGVSLTMQEKALKEAVHPKVAKEALIKLIISENLPFRIVESPHLFAFARALNPLIDQEILTSHSSVMNHISLLYQSYKESVTKMLQSAISSIHLSLDIWTSPNKILLLGICVHFVDFESNLRRLLIGLPQVFNHSADEMLRTLLPYLKGNKILKDVGYIISDNHTANDKLCRLLSLYLQDKEEVDWDYTQHRLRCIGHVINLAVQEFLFGNLSDEVSDSDDNSSNAEAATREEAMKPRSKEGWRRMGALGKLHNIVVYIRGGASTSKHQEFKDLAGRQVPLDNDTRWNSWYRMISVAIKLESTVDTFTKQHWTDLQADYLTPDDWAEIREIKRFLEVFHRATLSTEGYKGLIDKVLLSMDAIIKHYQDTQV